MSMPFVSYLKILEIFSGAQQNLEFVNYFKLKSLKCDLFIALKQFKQRFEIEFDRMVGILLLNK